MSFPRQLLLFAVGLVPACCLLPNTAAAQNSLRVQQLESRVEDFFGKLAAPSNDVRRALDELLVGSPLTEKTENVQKLAEQIEQMDTRYGSLLEAERLTTRAIGNDQDVVVLTYLYKAEKFPLTWHFVFYRPPSAARDDLSWVVVSIGFDTRLEKER